ncbi:MAG: hypothetical protein OWR52_03985 [Acidibacillus sp.]|uniref:Uncharacterized protein n=1 Tax=Sulfoacidibacillus ferrooxidans TaxID=2005001 RepID=A0A9X1V8D0_9BACL|nr:hypothetical protein [Sulfoacidibacillus ferrooxidans]MCI0183002.1 hypothetical protein [Sulfoacidibacillus ferrooxidans]MCY0892654.1 hypothetical protein [Acidibacillus sp.]
MDRRIFALGRHMLLFIRWAIVALILFTLVMGVIGFAAQWGEFLFHPELFLTNYRKMTEDIFSLLLVYEILDLIRTLSPNRLMDVILTVLARKILLSMNDEHLAIEVGAFCLILIVRLLWTRYGGLNEDANPMFLETTRTVKKEVTQKHTEQVSDT